MGEGKEREGWGGREEGGKQNSHGVLSISPRSAVVAVSHIPLSRGEEGGNEESG